MEMLESALESFAADVVFGVIVLGLVGSVMMAILFGALAIREAWRWLTRRSWNEVIVKTERKAFRA